MNALQIADELMKFYNLEENTAPIQIYDLAATMLRQQQAEIDALKANVDAINTSKQYVDKTQNNRHDLTDEEIYKTASDMNFLPPDLGKLFYFARAILRKAQEK